MSISKTAISVLVAALTVAPAPGALAHGHGGYRHHGEFFPVFGLAGAVVGTAAAILTLPFAIIGSAVGARPYYEPSDRGYAPTLAPPAYYAPAPAYYGPPVTAAPAYYPPPPPGYYGPPPGALVYPAPPTAYYAPRAGYYGGYAR